MLNCIVNVRPEEVRALLWSFGYFFCLLGAYYILRPLRDEMGVAGGVRNLQWLFTATFVAMLAVVMLLATLSHPGSAVVVVAHVLAVTGINNIERGLRSVYQRRPRV